MPWRGLLCLCVSTLVYLTGNAQDRLAVGSEYRHNEFANGVGDALRVFSKGADTRWGRLRTHIHDVLNLVLQRHRTPLLRLDLQKIAVGTGLRRSGFDPPPAQIPA